MRDKATSKSVTLVWYVELAVPLGRRYFASMSVPPAPLFTGVISYILPATVA